MATLTAAITAAQNTIAVTTPGTPRKGARYQINDELVEFIGPGAGTYREVVSGQWEWDGDEGSWYVSRGAAGTEAVSHSQGVTITEYVPTAGGGLPTGWEQAGDPADVTTNTGRLIVGVAGDSQDVQTDRTIFTFGAVETLELRGEVDLGAPFIRVGQNDVAGGEPQSKITEKAITVYTADAARAALISDGQFLAAPDDGYYAFEVGDAHASAAGALRAGGLSISEFSTLNPETPPTLAADPTNAEISTVIRGLGLAVLP